MASCTLVILAKCSHAACLKIKADYGLAYLLDYSPATVPVGKKGKYKVLSVNDDPKDEMSLQIYRAIDSFGNILTEVPEGYQVVVELGFEIEPAAIRDLPEWEGFAYNDASVDLEIELPD